jgi:hypothetical protein
MLSGGHRLPGPPSREPADHRQGKSSPEKHPWYANQWHVTLQDIPVSERALVLFTQAARWADEIRIQDKAQNKPRWHYINFPFKPEGQPASVQVRKLEPVNILTAMAENEAVMKNESNLEQKGCACVALQSGRRHTPVLTHGAAIHR